MRRTRRVFPRPLTFDTPGEAEEEEFFYSDHMSDALEAAATTGKGYDYGRNVESDWFDRACLDSVAVALEQSCDGGRLLEWQMRETRLRHFSFQQRFAAEKFLREIPPKIGKRLLPYIYWAVRIERAKRTGSPEFNPKRSLCIERSEEY